MTYIVGEFINVLYLLFFLAGPSPVAGMNGRTPQIVAPVQVATGPAVAHRR